MSQQTFGADGPQRVHIMLVDKLLLQHHLDGDDDLCHDDEQVACGEGRERTGRERKGRLSTHLPAHWMGSMAEPCLESQARTLWEVVSPRGHPTPFMGHHVPVITSLSLCFWSWELCRSASPTTTSPTMVTRMPSHWLSSSLRPRKATERSPVKMMTDPRSIWKLEALVMFKAGWGETDP